MLPAIHHHIFLVAANSEHGKLWQNCITVEANIWQSSLLPRMRLQTLNLAKKTICKIH